MIKFDDLSEKALKIFNETKFGELPSSDMVDYLFEADFERKEIESFVILNYTTLKDYLLNYIKRLYQYN